MTYKSALKVTAVVLVAFFLLVWLCALVDVAAHAAGCTVMPSAGYTSVNIRSTTVRNTDGTPAGAIVGQLLAGKSLDASPAANNFYSVPGGFVAASVVTATGCGTGQATLTATATVSPTYTPSPTWTPMPTPPALLIDSDGNPYTCDSLTPAPWLLLRPDGSWRGCVRVPTLAAPTRIVP